MEQQVEEFIKKHSLLEPGKRVLVGVSGGPDSLALLHFLWSMKEKKNISIIAAHLDHMFRGEESEEDMKYVMEFCRERGIVCEAAQINVSLYQQERGIGAQVAARECRYQFFEEAMKKFGASHLALAHHGDDQIETILMRLVRGSTMRGYAGIQVKRPFGEGVIIRPFLSVDKEQILEYCRRHNLKPRVDKSNEKEVYTRNRFRRHVLSFLKEENAQIHKQFQSYSEKLLEDAQYLEELTVQAMNKVMKKEKEELILIRDAFLQVRKPLQRRGIQLILNYLYKEIPPSLSSVHVDNLLTFLEREQPSGVLHFPGGLKVVRSYNDCLFTFRRQESSPYTYPLEIPGCVSLPEGHQIVCEIHNQLSVEVGGNDSLVLDMRKLTLPLVVRTRKNGDKITVKGMKGTKKVKDIFIDEKVPLVKRDTWPIIEDGSGRILWLPGLKKSAYESEPIHGGKYVILYYK
ncbi:MAG TPA: tRNA lysidine(34) synthetase TilS [Bacillus sp. (in: firmicutes)]|nr:tRNA lysidine(34) synthetase TilS [Bacillus sp. (in: firmicutes)]